MEKKKHCPICTRKAGFPVFKPLSEFHKRTTQKGYDSYCKACRMLLHAEKYRHKAAKAPELIPGLTPARPDRVFRGEPGRALKTIHIKSKVY